MARGFATWEFLDQMSLTKTKFLVQIKNNMKTELNPELSRIVWFCDRESRSEFRLAINVDEMTNEEVSETYRHRWQIEVLCQFIKMHLKLERLMTKSVKGVSFQIYISFIADLILQLREIPAFYGDK